MQSGQVSDLISLARSWKQSWRSRLDRQEVRIRSQGGITMCCLLLPMSSTNRYKVICTRGIDCPYRYNYTWKKSITSQTEKYLEEVFGTIQHPSRRQYFSWKVSLHPAIVRTWAFHTTPEWSTFEHTTAKIQEKKNLERTFDVVFIRISV